MELLNLEKYKAEIHRTLISKLDLEKLSRVNSSQARQAVSGIVKEIMAEQRVPLNYDEQEKIQADLLDEVFGLGPLEPLLRDPKISDILVNDKDHVFVEKGGLLQRVNTSFRDDRHLLQIIDRIVSRVGRRVDESSPMVDARLPDGSRVNAIIPPLALDGPSLSIRRFGTGPLAANQLVQLKSISAEMMEVLSAAVQGAHQHPDLRRHRRRQNHVPEHSVAVHSQQRAAGDHRRRGRTAAGAGEHRAPGNAAAEYRRPGRDPPAATADQQPAYAPRPHHHRRGARRRSLRHAAGHEHRPRRLDDHDSRQHAARRALQAGVDGGDDAT